MNIDGLMIFINEQWERLRKEFGTDNMTDREVVLAQTVKLSEETGELAEQILASQSLQRDKGKTFDKSAVADEIADVIITTLMIARHLDVDVNEALVNKIKKIETRYN